MKKCIFSLVSLLLLYQISAAQFIGQGGVNQAGGNFNQYLNSTLMKNVNPNAGKAVAVNVFNNTENTKGTRFLFDIWVNGDSVITTQGNYINTATFLFNFDKLTGNLIATQDKINIMAVAASGINSFMLENDSKQYVFEKVDAIDPLKFSLALIKNDSRYSLYKNFITKFTEANVRNDGIMQTGSEENEYKDESQYYIADKGAFKPVSFKPKAIKALLEEKKDKVDSYFHQHRDDAVDENFLVGLITYLNQ